jgi:hypothetical protein
MVEERGPGRRPHRVSGAKAGRPDPVQRTRTTSLRPARRMRTDTRAAA